MLNFLLDSQSGTPIKEIIQAVRILQKKNVSAVIAVKKGPEINNSISASEIVGKILRSSRRTIQLNLAEIELIGCLLPFPELLSQKGQSGASERLTDQELGCLGLSQESPDMAVISISGSGELAVFYQSSIRRSITPYRLYIILKFLFTEDPRREFLARHLAVKKV